MRFHFQLAGQKKIVPLEIEIVLQVPHWCHLLDLFFIQTLCSFGPGHVYLHQICNEANLANISDPWKHLLLFVFCTECCAK